MTDRRGESFEFRGWVDDSDFGERLSLEAVPRLLTGEDSILAKFTVYEAGLEAILVTTVEDGRTRLGLIQIDNDGLYPEDDEYVSLGVDVEGLAPINLDQEKSILVNQETLAQAIIDWVTVELDQIEDEDDPPFYLRKPVILRRLRDDAEAMLTVYRETGSLDEYEVSRTEKDLRAFIFENVDLPKMRKYIEENDPLPEFLETAISEYDEIEYKLSMVSERADWLSREVLMALREVDDERSIAAAQSWLPLWYEDDETAQRAADLLGQHIESEEARQNLRHVAEHHEDKSKRQIARAELERHGYSVE
ncbi:hypothetical protein [Haloarchaeobius sp. HME9146]|uniref:hypothetical protein n=1 Tax=Haloarchaeobius sp. HME9146 TaxID=2978732 RepID=UPI0021C14FE5|nr:hypothetical protein [Haloarchaeobius sp. HME9146]MCT9095444.1 hypothetical protein [Haloarchaeobius sp. HME9146]